MSLDGPGSCKSSKGNVVGRACTQPRRLAEQSVDHPLRVGRVLQDEVGLVGGWAAPPRVGARGRVHDVDAAAVRAAPHARQATGCGDVRRDEVPRVAPSVYSAAVVDVSLTQRRGGRRARRERRAGDDPQPHLEAAEDDVHVRGQPLDHVRGGLHRCSVVDAAPRGGAEVALAALPFAGRVAPAHDGEPKDLLPEEREAAERTVLVGGGLEERR
mmetsp:Transcript_50436/g.162312  ORF Transcript_50436/g.162312 Transcript_50436/m.162312 type:complete len:214 (+) Transcript_50436:183-824(+)